jgi:hypothetical protein
MKSIVILKQGTSKPYYDEDYEKITGVYEVYGRWAITNNEGKMEEEFTKYVKRLIWEAAMLENVQVNVNGTLLRGTATKEERKRWLKILRNIHKVHTFKYFIENVVKATPVKSQEFYEQ